ncbi:hypothetical protein SDC9_79890 [bioreactor metagenome]|uniref:Uncharacterized protein n=1 Tax=bioreactor metagenome TaxID=1076179 RepID=A0A644YY73_9ZZZZ
MSMKLVFFNCSINIDCCLFQSIEFMPCINEIISNERICSSILLCVNFVASEVNEVSDFSASLVTTSLDFCTDV